MNNIEGKLNPADILSNNPIKVQETEDSGKAEVYINTIIAYAVPKAISLSEIIQESENDEILKEVMKCIKNDD